MAKSDKVVDLRSKMRGMTIGKPSGDKPMVVTVEDVDFEVRRLSYADRRELTNKAAKFDMDSGKVDKFDQVVYEIGLLLACVYVPGTDERVFEKGDVETMRNQRLDADHWMQKLLDACLEMNKAGN